MITVPFSISLVANAPSPRLSDGRTSKYLVVNKTLEVGESAIGRGGRDEDGEEEGEGVAGVKTAFLWDLRLVEESGDAGGLGRLLVARDWIGD